MPNAIRWFAPQTSTHARVSAPRRRGPWLLAWIDGACDRELNRRRGFDYPQLPPEAAIVPSEDAVSIDAAMAMRATFAQYSPAVLAPFDALAGLLTGDGRGPWTCAPSALGSWFQRTYCAAVATHGR